MKRYLAEFIGTTLFTLVVTLAVAGKFPVVTPVVAALALAVLVYALGHISGAHLNPAVTIGLWSINKVKSKDVLGYVVAQGLGALLTYYLARSFVGMVPMHVADSFPVLMAEFLGTFVFLFCVAAVAYGHVPTDVTGAAVGGALLIGLVVAAVLGSNAALNPAIAFSIGSFSWGYVVAPILGSVVGMNLYRWLSEMKHS
jgi:aquaporin Z